MSETTTGGADAVKARHHYHDLRVARVIRETSDASSVVFEIPADLAPVFAYASGQFLTLQIPYEGHQLYRCYSLASSPAVDAEHKVTVKRVDGGRVSNWINTNLKAGDVIKVLPPAGHFVLGDSQTDLLLFAGGSGITPVISILKTALAASGRKVRLVYANRDEASVIFRAEIDALAAGHPGRVDVIHRLDVRDGFMDEAVVRNAVAGREHCEVYLCGPGPFMDVVERSVLAAGIPAERVHIERFAAAEVDEQAVAGSGAAVRQVELVLDGASQTIDVRDGETVLHAAKRCGLEPPSSCESGFCGCCMAKVGRGRVHMLVNDFLSASEVEEGWVLTCQAVPETDDTQVEYPD